MRVTSTSYADNLIAQLQAQSSRQSTLQQQIASGQRIQTADQDPLAMQQVLALRDDTASMTQFSENIKTHQEFATVSGNVLKSLTKILDRAQEIAVRADGTASPKDLQSYGTEVGQLIRQAIDLANTQHRGEYILAGTKSGSAPFTSTTDADGKITSVNYSGAGSTSESEIAPGVLVSSRMVGENSSGSGERGLFADSRFGADLFGHLIALKNQLDSGDVTTIAQTTRADLQKDEDNVLYHVGDNGALQSRLEASLTHNADVQQSIEGELSRKADTDLPSTIVKLNQTQTSYQATLQSAGSILNLTLLDFLR
jgi:flagellar hook-associated protein 3 FlgL